MTDTITSPSLQADPGPRPTASPRHPVVKAFADPAALGLGAFALTTFMASFANAGILSGAAAATLGLALFYGGLGQVLAGMWEFAQGNTFGALSFTSFGAFWLAYWWLQTNPELLRAAGGAGVGLFMICWAVLAAFLTVSTLRISWTLFALFALLALTLLGLGIGALTSVTWISYAGGYIGIATGLVAWYGSFASVVNATWRRNVIPTGEIAES
ncbi:acetate uptake transporter [Curtobacterium flaccumfaciens pv. flaccumfaciens]|uniref:acetate uptake transporter n=1 Tax=Curtobacterium flaccumfaciens TaxID=2035 RepID=UPI003AB86CEB